MHPIIDANRAAISELCGRFGVARLDVFGSAADAARFSPLESDVDFIVEYRRDTGVRPLEAYFGLRDALEDVLGLPVDLVEAGAIRNPYILNAINSVRETVYAA